MANDLDELEERFPIEIGRTKVCNDEFEEIRDWLNNNKVLIEAMAQIIGVKKNWSRGPSNNYVFESGTLEDYREENNSICGPTYEVYGLTTPEIYDAIGDNNIFGINFKDIINKKRRKNIENLTRLIREYKKEDRAAIDALLNPGKKGSVINNTIRSPQLPDLDEWEEIKISDSETLRKGEKGSLEREAEINRNLFSDSLEDDASVPTSLQVCKKVLEVIKTKERIEKEKLEKKRIYEERLKSFDRRSKIDQQREEIKNR